MNADEKHRLLQRFQPCLRYDSLEVYFADSAEEWTTSPDNVLVRRKGDDVAAGHGLSLDFLGPTYADKKPADRKDRIESKNSDYSRRYAELRESHQDFRNVTYGRVWRSCPTQVIKSRSTCGSALAGHVRCGKEHTPWSLDDGPEPPRL